MRITVYAGPHHRRHTPVSIALPDLPGDTGRLTQRSDGSPVPFQVHEGRLHFIVSELAAGNQRHYTFDPQGKPPRFDMATLRHRSLAGQVKIKIAGRKYLTWHLGSPEDLRPHVLPLIGPCRAPLLYGREALAIAEKVEVTEEAAEDDLHEDLWIGFGDVSGVDHWSPGGGRQEHQALPALIDGQVFGQLEQLLHWKDAAGETQLRERRTLRVHVTPEHTRFVDVSTVLTAQQPVTLRSGSGGGPLGVRMAEELVHSPHSRLISCAGSQGIAEVDGVADHWVDWSGPSGGRIAGLCIFDHPDNPGHPTRWRADAEGRLGVAAAPTEGWTLEAGQALRFTYRLLLHRGHAERAALSDRYQDWVRPPRVELPE